MESEKKNVVLNPNVDVERLREFGFKLGKEWADAGERCFDGCTYAYDWYHKFLMDYDNPNKIRYIDDDYEVAAGQIIIKPETGSIYVDMAISDTYHISGDDLDMVIETIFDLTNAGLLIKK